MASFHGAFAGALQQLGRHGEALEQFQKALVAELALVAAFRLKPSAPRSLIN